MPGLTRLKRHTRSPRCPNGNIGLLTDMAKRAGLPWDCILSAEVFRAYKPDPAVYRGAARVFDRQPEQVMLVAAHHDDLAAAAPAACTPPTSNARWVRRGTRQDVSPQPGNALHAASLVALADQLDC